jgi:RND family efflux transporter MFP subunit
MDESRSGLRRVVSICPIPTPDLLEIPMSDIIMEAPPPPGHVDQERQLDAGQERRDVTDTDHGPLRRRRLLVYGLGALTVAIVVAVYGVVDRGWSEDRLVQLTAQEAIPAVDVIHPEVGVTGERITLPGTINAYFEAPIYARVSGYLKMWYKDIGAHVTAGELLATIETPDLDQELAQAKANLAVADANYRLAQVTANRWQKLLRSDAVSVQAVDVKAGDAAAKQASVAAAQANVARLEAQEAFRRIVAPFDGTITARRTDVGALINAGSGVGPELFAVADVHKMRVYVRVPQAESADIVVGMKASLSLPQFPEQAFPATVLTTANAIDPLSNTLLVELMANNPKGVLAPGTFADVHFELPPQPDVVRIPTSAVLFRAGGLKVATVGPDGKALIRSIRPGRDLGTQMEVLGGLTPADRVIDSPPDSLTEGEKVRLAGASFASTGAEPIAVARK